MNIYLLILVVTYKHTYIFQDASVLNFHHCFVHYFAKQVTTFPNFHYSVLHVAENLKDVKLKLPLIYLLDCTLNDCSLILRSINQV